MDRYFYIIEQGISQKVIHMQGNIYASDDGKYTYAEWTFLYMEIPEAKNRIEAGTFFEHINMQISYIGDISQEAVTEAMENYFDGEPGTELHISDITENTPCGCYWFENDRK